MSVSLNELKTKPEFVILACRTFKRPNMLGLCLENVKKMKFPSDIKVEMLVIDNDCEQSAKPVIEKFREDFPIKINYFVEEKRGLSNAGNKLISEALNLGATHIMMFDDDILPPENQLQIYLDYYEKNQKAVILTAASYSKFTKKVPKYIEKNDLFKTSDSKKTGQIRTDCATGNVFFPATLMSVLNLKFDDKYVFMGGEDGAFFASAGKLGATIVWCKEAFNFELNDEDKANIPWILERSYYNGYSAAFLKKNNLSKLQRIFLILKYNFSFVINCMILPLSVFFGSCVFVNMLGFCAKSLGRLVGSTMKKPLERYKNICGS